jgi:hypothetical protein
MIETPHGAIIGGIVRGWNVPNCQREIRMPPAASAPTNTGPTQTPSANPQRPDDGHAPDAKADSRTAKSEPADKGPGLFVVVAQPREGGQIVELHSDESAEARVSMLTYGSKQHRKEAEDAEEQLPDGGGSHEINRRDIHVFKLNATEVSDF